MDNELDLNWWRGAKASSLARKKRCETKSNFAQPGDSFLIVTEGEVTESLYFKLLLNDLRLGTAKVIIQSGGGKSDSRQVIESAAEFAKKQARKSRSKSRGIAELNKFDHVWAVIDTDVAVRGGFWAE